MKHAIAIILSMTIAAPAVAAETCFTDDDPKHVTLSGEIVQSKFIEADNFSDRPAETKYLAIVLDDPICFVGGDPHKFVIAEAEPVPMKWLGHHVSIVGNLSYEGHFIFVEHIKDTPYP